MLFRSAVPSDVPHIVPMLLEQYRLHIEWEPAKFGVIPNFEQGYARWLTSRTHDPQAVFLVATSDTPPHPDTPVGFLIATIEDELPLYTTRQYGFIHDLFVTEPYRHEGAARQLVTLAVERFKQLGIPQVRCETAPQNNPAQSLFLKAGFRAVSTIWLTET